MMSYGKINSIYIFILCSVLVGSLYSQNPKDEIIKINEKFVSIKNYSIDMDFETYIDNNFQKPYKTVSTKMIKKGKDLYYKRQNVEMMQNDKYTVSVDHGNKLIIIQNTDFVSRRKQTEYDLVSHLDSIMKIYSDVKIENIHGLRKMTFEFKTTEYKKCVVVYHPDTYLVESFTVDYRNPMRFSKDERHEVTNIVRYKSFSTQPMEKKDFFSEKKYVIMQDKKQVKPAAKFQEYQVVSKIKQG